MRKPCIFECVLWLRQLEPTPVRAFVTFWFSTGLFASAIILFSLLQGSHGAAAPVSHGLHLFLLKIEKPFFLHLQASIVDLHFEQVAVFGFTF